MHAMTKILVTYKAYCPKRWWGGSFYLLMYRERNILALFIVNLYVRLSVVGSDLRIINFFCLKLRRLFIYLLNHHFPVYDIGSKNTDAYFTIVLMIHHFDQNSLLSIYYQVKLLCCFISRVSHRLIFHVTDCQKLKLRLHYTFISLNQLS